MKTVEEQFEEVKQNCHNNISIYSIQDYVLKEDAIRIANEVRTHALQEAAEKAQLQRVVNGVEQKFEWKQIWEYDNTFIQVSKQSILNLIKEKQH